MPKIARVLLLIAALISLGSIRYSMFFDSTPTTPGRFITLLAISGICLALAYPWRNRHHVIPRE